MCEGQSNETGFSTSSQFMETDKEYVFYIKTGEEPLEIRMVDQNAQNEYSYEGFYQIYLNDLKDQNKI